MKLDFSVNLKNEIYVKWVPKWISLQTNFYFMIIHYCNSSMRTHSRIEKFCKEHKQMQQKISITKLVQPKVYCIQLFFQSCKRNKKRKEQNRLKTTYNPEVKRNQFRAVWEHQQRLEHFLQLHHATEGQYSASVASEALPSDPFQCVDT